MTTTQLFSFLLVTAVYPGLAAGQITETKLIAGDGEWYKYFGSAVSVSGNYLIVGAYNDGINGFQTGSAYVFRRDSMSWIEEQKLTAPGGNARDRFGFSVSISGDYAIVGADGEEDNGFDSGAAYVFRREGTTWIMEQKLRPSDVALGDHFGYSVSISGDYCVVGAYENDDRGAAFIFGHRDTHWFQVAKLVPDGMYQSFGWSVSISGDSLIVSASTDNHNGNASGSAYVFSREDTSWIQEAKLLPSDGSAEDHFGFSVSILGEYAIVGAPQNGPGAAYIFRGDGTSWTQETKLTASDGVEDDRFGNSVSISGDYIIVGANQDGAGSAYLFRHDGTSWTQEVKLTASDASEFDYFGRRVSIFGDYALVGEHWDTNENGFHTGAVYVYSGFSSQPAISVGVSLSASSGDGSFDYDVEFANLTENSVTVDVWTEVSGPGGRSKVGSVRAKTLQGNGVYSETRTANIGEEGVPLGDYIFRVNVGEYPDVITSSASASYTKTSFAKAQGSLHETIPATTELLGNYPDPFNPSTTIRYALSADSHVTLRIYNMLGQTVGTLVNEPQKAGYQSVVWNGRNDSGAGVAGGIYIYRVTADRFVATKQMVLLK